MNCKNIHEKMGLYLDLELAETEAKEILAHIENCSNCSEHRDEIMQVKTALNRIEIPMLSESFEDLLQQKILHVNSVSSSDDAENVYRLKQAVVKRSKINGLKYQSLAASVTVVAFLTSLFVYMNVKNEGNNQSITYEQHAELTEFLLVAYDDGEFDLTFNEYTQLAMNNIVEACNTDVKTLPVVCE